MRWLGLIVVAVASGFVGAYLLVSHGLSYKQLDFWIIILAIVVNTIAWEGIIKGPINTKS